jgi:6-phosphogluconolactonase
MRNNLSQSPPNKEWIILSNASDVAVAALNIILSAAKSAIKKTGKFKIVLAGGSTPEQVYKMLAKEKCDWEHWEFYLGDERCLPIRDPERNSEMIRRTFLDKINIPENNVYFIPSELGSEKAAEKYSYQIASALPFDMVMLGMGEDGHTASLFPGHNHNQDELVHAIHNAPKPPSERVSLSSRCLSQTHHLLILITGAGKKTALTQWKKGEKIPVSTLSPLGNMTVLLDKAASPESFD